MTKNCCLILGMAMATSLFAQDNNTNTLPPMPAPLVTPAAETSPAANAAVAPAKRSAAPVKHKKPAPKRAALHEPNFTLTPGPAEVAVANLNVRGQAGLRGEVISHLNKGATVMVLAQVNLARHEVGEPAHWAKISLPDSTHVWVSALFIDGATKTVKATRLNLRAGPGENYSVLGTVDHGEAVNEISRKGNWIQIKAPTNAYAFVAAMYLKQEASGNLVASTEPSSETEPAAAAAAGMAASETGSEQTQTQTQTPTPTEVTEAQPIVTEPATNGTEVAAATPAANSGANPSETSTGGTSEANVNGESSSTSPRIVSHEGVVGLVDSLIAPTAYDLYDPVTRREINYLYTTSTNLDIGRYYGMRIVVTGEESLAKRWPNTPVLTIQRIQVLETNAIKKVYYPAPRQRR